MESAQIQVTGYVVREACATPSHPRSQMGLSEFLERYEIPGLSGVDTRMLTTRTRSRGTMRAALVAGDEDPAAILERVRAMPFPDQARNLVAEVSCTRPVFYNGPARQRFVVIDCGLKMNIVREALQYADVIQMPWDTPADAVLAQKPDGVVISNGPGDPAHPDVRAHTVRAVADLAGKVPLLGICLGHQILGLALGGTTYKLKFGHRGGNQPVKDLETGRVHITSQNHGFSVDAASVEDKGLVITHRNLNDGTVEGFRHRDLPILSVQYHPEANPGPKDSRYLFHDFAKLAGV